MVDSRSGYKFSTDLDDIRIDGGIMPFRNGDEKRDVRGEDIAFLGEAADECYAVVGAVGTGLYAGRTRTSMKDTRLLASRPYMIAKAFKAMERPSYGIKYVTRQKLTTTPVYRSKSSTRPSWHFIDHMSVFNVIGKSVNMVTDADSFQAGKEMHMSDIDDLFKDSQQVLATVSQNDSISGVDIGYSVYEKIDDPKREGGNYSYEFYLRNNSGAWDDHGKFKERLTSGYFRAGGFRTYGVGLGVVAYAAMLLTNIVTSRTGGTISSSYDQIVTVVQLPAHLAHGEVRVNAADVGNAAARMVSYNDVVLHEYKGAVKIEDGVVSQHLTVDPISWAVQRIRGNHTLYSS